MIRTIFMSLFLAVACIAITAQAGSQLLKDSLEHFAPLPDQPVYKAGNPGSREKLELGKMLFFDTRLSKSNVFSCNSCHNLAGGGVDNNPFSTGHKWQVGGRNAPTVFNASLHIAQFWDGRAEDVEAQAQGPILAGVEMAATKELALKRIGSIPEYQQRFATAFPGQENPFTYENIANAIGAFERTLLTPSRFDMFLKGNESALTDDEKAGLGLFIEKGCADCHDGIAVGGGGYREFGVSNKPEGLTDRGRIEVTNDEGDMHVFKVPSLRNIELTYPYFHDGSVFSLNEAISIMGWTQLGEKLTDSQIGSISTFLRSLTGERPDVTLPALPPSTKETPIPDRF